MAQLWKYITELSQTDESYEESDLVVINQGGHSVQIPWSILKAGIEAKISNMNSLLDRAVFTGSDEEEGYIEADVTIDALKQDVTLINETLVNIKSTLEQMSSAINKVNQSYNSLLQKVNEQGNSITSIENNMDSLPTITHGDVDPNTIIDKLKPKENDIYIYTGNLTE